MPNGFMPLTWGWEWGNIAGHAGYLQDNGKGQAVGGESTAETGRHSPLPTRQRKRPRGKDSTEAAARALRWGERGRAGQEVKHGIVVCQSAAPPPEHTTEARIQKPHQLVNVP